MIVTIEIDYWPTHYISATLGEHPAKGRAVQVPAELLTRFAAARAEWEAVQRELITLPPARALELAPAIAG